jgi:hypothetical protein
MSDTSPIYKKVWYQENKSHVTNYNKEYYLKRKGKLNPESVKSIPKSSPTLICAAFPEIYNKLPLNDIILLQPIQPLLPKLTLQSLLPQKYIESINKNYLKLYDNENKLFASNIKYNVNLYKSHSLFRNVYNDPMLSSGYIYIIRTQDCKRYIPNNDEVFKIGITSDIFLRLCYYGPDVELLYCMKVETSLTDFERDCLSTFRNSCNFDCEKLFGNEYFSGKIHLAYDTINTLLSDIKYHKNHTCPTTAEITKIIKLDIPQKYNPSYNYCIHPETNLKEYFYILRIGLPQSANFIYKLGYTKKLINELNYSFLSVEILLCINIERNSNIFKSQITALSLNLIENKYIICNTIELFTNIKSILLNDIYYDPIYSLKTDLWHTTHISKVITYPKILKIHNNYNLFKNEIETNKKCISDIAIYCNVSIKQLFWLLYKVPYVRYVKYVLHS